MNRQTSPGNQRAAAYFKEGYLSGIPVLTPEETAWFRKHFEEHAKRLKGPLGSRYKHKNHLMLDWMDALVHHPAILSAVTEILGPDVLCWTSNLFIKSANTPEFVSWHQDSQYWNLEPDHVLTAWIALSPSNPASGCLRVLPGSHTGTELVHHDRFTANNMLTRGQTIEDIDETKVLDLTLAPGQMSLHHIRLAHGSNPNRSDEDRIGIAIRYASTQVAPIGRKESALLVCGTDTHKNFLHERRPLGHNTLEGRQAHNRAIRLQVQNNYLPAPSSTRRQRLRLPFARLATHAVLDALYLGLKLRVLFQAQPR